MRAKDGKLRPLLDAYQLGTSLFVLQLILPGVLRQEIGYPAGDIAFNVALALIACGYVYIRGDWREIGFRRPDAWRVLWWFVPLALTTLLPIRWHVYASVWTTVVFALFYLAQSIQTRVIFDGWMVRKLLALGPWVAAMTPAVLQGGLLAAEFSLVPPERGFVQILLLLALSTVAAEFMAAALRIRTGLLWPLIVIDVVEGIVYYVTLRPNPSPYPLTATKVIISSVSAGIAVIVACHALLSAHSPRAQHAPGDVAATAAGAQGEAEHEVISLTGAQYRSDSRRRLAAMFALSAGIVVIVCSFGASVTGLAGQPPKYQAGSQRAYFAARPGTGCDTGSGHWFDDDPEVRYTCRADGLEITQVKFDYASEAYFAFTDETQSSVPFKAHSYQVAADARIVGGELGTCVSIQAHVQDFEGRQWFEVCDDGTWDIGRCNQQCNEDTVLLTGTLPKPTERFSLVVTVTDRTMTCMVNGAQVGILHDATYTTTDQLVLAVEGPANTQNLPSAVFANFRYTPVA